MPPQSIGLKQVLSYYQSAVKVNPEGDVHLSDETILGLGTPQSFLYTHLFGAILQIIPIHSHQHHRPRLPDVEPPEDSPDQSQYLESDEGELLGGPDILDQEEEAHHPVLPRTAHVERSNSIRSLLIACVPHPGYFLAGGLSGVASRTTTAPLDRLKVYLIAQTDNGGHDEAVRQAKKGMPLKATKHAGHTLVNACRDLWAAGGMRSLFAGLFVVPLIGDNTDIDQAMVSILSKSCPNPPSSLALTRPQSVP